MVFEQEHPRTKWRIFLQKVMDIPEDPVQKNPPQLFGRQKLPINQPVVLLAVVVKKSASFRERMSIFEAVPCSLPYLLVKLELLPLNSPFLLIKLDMLLMKFAFLAFQSKWFNHNFCCSTPNFCWLRD